MSMALLISKLTGKPPTYPMFIVGQRVKLSVVGRDSLRIMPHHATEGTIVKAPSSYPDSIAVIRDGSKRPLHYHASYWELA
jgi:hypothetical protein